MYSCYFWTIKRLHIWTIHITHLDDWGHISGRVVLRLNTIVMVGLRIRSLLDGSKWHFMPCKDMLYKQYQAHSIILCSIFISFMLFLKEEYVTYLDDSCNIFGRLKLHIWTIWDSHRHDCRGWVWESMRFKWIEMGNAMPCHNVTWKDMLLYIIIENSNRTVEHYIAININSFFFVWTIKRLHIWTIRVSYLNDLCLSSGLSWLVAH